MGAAPSSDAMRAIDIPNGLTSTSNALAPRSEFVQPELNTLAAAGQASPASFQLGPSDAIGVDRAPLEGRRLQTGARIRRVECRHHRGGELNPSTSTHIRS